MRTGAASAVGARRHNENDVIMGTGAVSAASARRHNENDVTVTIAGLPIEIWRLATCGQGLHRSSFNGE